MTGLRKMGWQETVMNDTEIAELYNHQMVAQAQAEISFKAGIKYAMDTLLIVEDGKPDFCRGRRAGIKEVVEQVGERFFTYTADDELIIKSVFSRRDVEWWQAKLKEWRL